MKRITLIAILFGLGAIGAQAGNVVNNQVLKETNFRNAQWMGNDNTAGLSFKPFQIYKDLGIGFDYTSGEFHKQLDADVVRRINANTSGSAYLGKFLLWGNFSYNNIKEKGCTNNALMYEVDDDMPYYPVDTTRNNIWNKQEFLLKAKLASPVFWDMFSFGVSIDYENKVGAKQIDPRAETYRYRVDVRPGVVFRVKDHYIGINGHVMNYTEESDPTNMNNWKLQPMYLHKGLGESTLSSLGSNTGIKEYMFKSMMYGGNIQYAYHGGVDLLIDLEYKIRTNDVKSEPKLPKPEGSTKGSIMGLKADILFGNSKSNHFWLNGQMRKTTGTEYVVKIVSESSTMQYWKIMSENPMSEYVHTTVDFGYDHLFGASDERGYDWIVGATGNFTMRKEEYFLPTSTFDYGFIRADVFGGKHFKFKKSSLLIKVNGGYSHSLGSDYLYAGPKPTYEPVKMYQANSQHYSISYAKVGGMASYTLNTKKIGYIFNVKGDYYMPMGVKIDRFIINASFGIVF